MIHLLRTHTLPISLLIASVMVAAYVLVSSMQPLTGNASYFGPPGEPDYPGCILTMDPSTGQYGELCCFNDNGNGLYAQCNWNPYPSCTANPSCAADTCSGSSCTDSCGNNYAGTKTCTVTYTCQDYGYQYGTLGNCWNSVPCTASNACGTTASGYTTDFYGTCSATPPALPSNYGQACSSGANSCGMVNTGTYGCYNNCSAPTPSNSLCPVTPTETCYTNPTMNGCACTSSANSCGQTNAGTYQNSVCSATAPAVVDQCPSDAGNQCSTSQCTPPPSCTPSNACAANTCSGTSCTDTCGNSYAGTKTGGSCTTGGGCNLADPYCYCSTYPSDPWCAEGGGTPSPDITATIVPGSAMAPNVVQTLRAYTGVDWSTVTNRTWPNIFQVQSTGAGMTPVDVIVSASATQAPSTYNYFGDNSYQYFTANYTFTQQGFYRYRACADNNASWQGSVDESNEGNNCSGWTSVYVSSGGACTSPVSVIGKTDADGGGGVWGSGPYSYDSDMNKAAVHAGLITRGQSAIVSTDNQRAEYYFNSSYRNGVTTDYWEGWYTAVDLSLCSIITTGPNLRAGSVSPTSASAGSAITLTAPISNTGSVSTGGSFSNLFQRATDSNGANATDIGSPTMTALGAGSSGTAQLANYTFSAGGTYYVRVCADKNAAGSLGTITETDESDNCGAWTPVTVTSAAVSCSLSATSPITAGNSSTLTWSSSNATSCTGSGFSTGGAVSGSRSVSPSSTSSYGLSCTNSSGGATCNATPATVVVNGSNCSGPASITITATPARVQPGQTSTITWNANNVPGVNGVCTVSGPGISQNATADSTSSCALSGSATTPALSTQSTYTITCPGGTTKTVIVNVLPKFEEF